MLACWVCVYVWVCVNTEEEDEETDAGEEIY